MKCHSRSTDTPVSLDELGWAWGQNHHPCDAKISSRNAPAASSGLRVFRFDQLVPIQVWRNSWQCRQCRRPGNICGLVLSLDLNLYLNYRHVHRLYYLPYTYLLLAIYWANLGDDWTEHDRTTIDWSRISRNNGKFVFFHLTAHLIEKEQICKLLAGPWINPSSLPPKMSRHDMSQ